MINISNHEIKEIVYSLGGDLCGVAGMERFNNAPKGFHPLDVLPSCKSVISFAVRFPVGALKCETPVPYTRIRNSLTPKMDAIALNLCIELEKRGIVSVPIPTNESLWDEETNRWRSIISQKHAAQAAGVGRIGRHSLLITKHFGSMVWLGSVLCEAEIEPDEMIEDICIHCNRCVQVCPVNALENITHKSQQRDRKTVEHGTAVNEILAKKSAKYVKKHHPNTTVKCFKGKFHCENALFNPEIMIVELDKIFDK